MISSPITCTRKEVHNHMTSSIVVCEVDLDMQMSFLHVAPCCFCSFKAIFCWKEIFDWGATAVLLRGLDTFILGLLNLFKAFWV